MRRIGVPFTREYVQRFGLPAEHIPADLTTALGTAQLTPLEIANGFAVFANGGSLTRPHIIDRILAADGSVLEATDAPVACSDCAASPAPFAGDPPVFVPAGGGGVVRASDVGGSLPQPEPEQRAPRAISEANAWIVTDMLRDVINRGTGQRARALGRNDIAGKTGTTSRDATPGSRVTARTSSRPPGSDTTRNARSDATRKARALRCRCGSTSCARRSRVCRNAACRCPTAS